jgi:tryptophan 2,3-dioxygenase
MPKGDIKIVINAHGNSAGIKGRSVGDIAKHIDIVSQAAGNDSRVKKVSLIPCMLGVKYAKMLLPELRKYGIKSPQVSVRLGNTAISSNGRQTVVMPDLSRPGEYLTKEYRSEKLKATYTYNEAGEIVPVDSYTDEHYGA